MTDETIYKIAIAAFLHDIGKFAERASVAERQLDNLEAGFYLDKQFLLNNMDLYQPHYNNNYTHKHAVYTAGFIDHIEKFLPRTFNKGEWGLDDSFMNLAAGHHKPTTPLQWIIAMADRVSSGFDRDEFENYNKGIGVKDYKKTRLLTIFEGISPDGIWRDDNLESYRFRYPLKELSPENIFPVVIPPLEKGGEGGFEKAGFEDDRQASDDYRDLFLKFVSSLEGLIHKQNIPLWFEHFDSLYMIYTSHIPAAAVGKVVPDVSLYDHSKTTAALASAMYLYHKQSGTMDVGDVEKIKDYDYKKFLIVTGDFYGIQNFIFSEGGSTNKASAKLLRGRSFAVSLISELAADMLCREIGLTPISIILNAAGKFTLIAPNTKETIDKIMAVEEKINDWLVKKYYGESAIGISYIDASGSDFKSERFSELWDRLAKASERRKYSKINLDTYGGSVKDYLDQFNNDLSKKLCPFCGKRPSSIDGGADPFVSDGESACGICRDHIYIGTNLVKAPLIAITTVDADIYGDKLKEPVFGKYQVSLDVTGKLSELANAGTLLKYWDISIAKDGNIAKYVTAKFINGYVPKYTDVDETDENINRLLHGEKTEKKKEELFNMIKEGLPKSFHHISKKALNPTEKSEKFTGIEALGILKADVDNLGLTFACGIRRLSLSRLATLSRQMNYYFSVFLPCALSTREEFKDIYTVFAGGDDLFLIGPWNRIIDFASFLNDSFSKYVCNNNNITISAGISVNKPGEPIRSISEMSENALKKSKNNNRNSITVFNETVKWDEFNELNKIRISIQDWIDKGFINKAMLFRLSTFSKLANQEREIKKLLNSGKRVDLDEMECLKWGAKFKYNLVRNIGKNLKGDKKADAVGEVEKAADWLIRHGGSIKIPVWQIIYNQR
ncbi:MAG: type III-A CRISPR-associated protein Cas10/Csm1 [Thermodesulfovibrio sp. RBG_19FT_COMBO_42_12]|nr:MAG: type III-A CRISPR-associated protein Cas10/Csm1 [Thermodesulfovibrio sp. RBG_19FT_COMBO_42_12]